MDGSQAVAEEHAADGSRQSGCEGMAIMALEPCAAGASGALAFLLRCLTLSFSGVRCCSPWALVAEALAASQAGWRSSLSTSRPSSPGGFRRDLSSRVGLL